MLDAEGVARVDQLPPLPALADRQHDLLGAGRQRTEKDTARAALRQECPGADLHGDPSGAVAEDAPVFEVRGPRHASDHLRDGDRPPLGVQPDRPKVVRSAPLQLDPVDDEQSDRLGHVCRAGLLPQEQQGDETPGARRARVSVGGRAAHLKNPRAERRAPPARPRVRRAG